MGIEIERRFLAKNDEWREDVASSSSIVQGYFVANKELSIRARVRRFPDGTSKAGVAFKSFITDASRHEFEYEIPVEDALEMLEKLPVFVIRKIRHIAKIDGLVFEIDEYEGRNGSLVLVELELPDEPGDFVAPSWLGAEVTFDGRYSNAYLSRHPYDEWTERERAMIVEDGGSL